MSQGSHFHIGLQGGVHQKFNNLQKFYHITIKWDQKLDPSWGFSHLQLHQSWSGVFFLLICISYYCQLVHNFTDIKGGSQTKAQIRADPVITKLSHPLSQLFKLVKLISSFEIVWRKVLLPVGLFEINELNDCYEKVIFISP